MEIHIISTSTRLNTELQAHLNRFQSQYDSTLEGTDVIAVSNILRAYQVLRKALQHLRHRYHDAPDCNTLIQNQHRQLLTDSFWNILLSGFQLFSQAADPSPNSIHNGFLVLAMMREFLNLSPKITEDQSCYVRTAEIEFTKYYVYFCARAVSHVHNQPRKRAQQGRTREDGIKKDISCVNQMLIDNYCEFTGSFFTSHYPEDCQWQSVCSTFTDEWAEHSPEQLITMKNWRITTPFSSA